jgi:hypothetical protein
MPARRLGQELLVLFLAIAPGCSAIISAKAQQASSTLPAADNNGQDFTRPENLFQIRNLYQTAPGNGSLPGTLRTVTTDMTILRADGVVALTQQWSIAFRGDLPFVIRDPHCRQSCRAVCFRARRCGYPGGADPAVRFAMGGWRRSSFRRTDRGRGHHKRQMARAASRGRTLFFAGVEHGQLRRGAPALRC